MSDSTGEATERRIAEWRTYVSRRRAIHGVDVDELEDHLRGSLAELARAGLSEEEAFLVAAKRLGDLDSLSREFAREYSERLWKQLVVGPGARDEAATDLREATVALALAVGAAVAVRLPELFGRPIDGSEANGLFYLRNASLFVFPFLAIFFAWKRGLGGAGRWWLAAPFVVAAGAVNLPVFGAESHTGILAALHLPIALWLTVGFAYVGGDWRSHPRRMDFVRFTGEWFIYYALIGLGGGVLMGTTAGVFAAIGIDVETVLERWILPVGVAGAVVVAAWLVEAKQSVVENMAPVLTRLFTPLFVLLLTVFLATMLWTGQGISVEREVLIGFDLLLVVVLGLLLYSISARDPLAPPGPFDWLQLALVVLALLVDAFALWAIAGRISTYGLSPNRAAALGENLVLLVNLGVSAVLYARFLTGRGRFPALERWQTAYLPVYAVWAWVVVILFPPLFGYR